MLQHFGSLFQICSNVLLLVKVHALILISYNKINSKLSYRKCTEIKKVKSKNVETNI